MGATGNVRNFTSRCRKCLNKYYLENHSCGTRHGFNVELISRALNSAIMRCIDCKHEWRTTAKYIYRNFFKESKKQ